MLSSVLRSDRAIDVNIEIMRAFVRLREVLATHEDLARKLADLEKKYAKQFAVVFRAIRKLMEPPKGKIVDYRVTPIYKGGDSIPSGLTLKAFIDGKLARTESILNIP